MNLTSVTFKTERHIIKYITVITMDACVSECAGAGISVVIVLASSSVVTRI